MVKNVCFSIIRNVLRILSIAEIFHTFSVIRENPLLRHFPICTSEYPIRADSNQTHVDRQASMDAEVITTVEQLRGEVAEIRKLGRRWGFEDGEINECLSEALDAVNKSSPKSKKPVGQLGKLGKCLRYGCFTLIAFLLAIFVFFAVISMLDEKSTAFLTKYLVSLSYPLLRYSRLMFLPVHGMFNVTGW